MKISLKNNIIIYKMEDLEKQFITSYESTLAKEGKEICEKILVYIGEKDKMIMEKAKAFCEFFMKYKLDGVDTKKLIERCEKYLYDMKNYRRIKQSLEEVNINRRLQEELFEQRGGK